MKWKIVICVLLTACLGFTVYKWAAAPLFSVVLAPLKPGETDIQFEMRTHRPNLVNPKWLADNPEDVIPESWLMIEQTARLVVLLAVVWIALWTIVFTRGKTKPNNGVDHYVSSAADGG